MAVTPPSSGDTITTSTISDMYDTVKTIVNGMDETRFDRSALRHDQLPSILVGGDTKVVTATENVTTVMTNETTGDITANWQLLTNYTLDGVASAGYTLPPCYILAFATLYMDDIAPTQSGLYGWLLANLYYSIGSAEVVQSSQTRAVPMNQDGVSFSAATGTRIDENMTLVHFIDQTAAGGNFTLDYFRIKAALMDQAGGETAMTQVDIKSGSIGFIALYKD